MMQVSMIAAISVVALYFILIDKIDKRFDKVDKEVGAVSQQLEDFRVELARQGNDLKSIREKVEAEQQNER